MNSLDRKKNKSKSDPAGRPPSRESLKRLPSSKLIEEEDRGVMGLLEESIMSQGNY